MFCRRCRRQKKKHRDNVEVGDEKSSSPQKSAEEDPKEDPVVPGTPATSAATDSAPAEAPKEKAKKPSWWRRWCRRKTTPVKEDEAEDPNLPPSATEDRYEVTSVNTFTESEDGEAGVQEASSTSDTPVSAAPELQPENTDVAEDTDLPSSATERRFEITSVDTIKESEGGEAGVQEASSTPDTPVSAAPELQPENTDVAEDTDLPPSATERRFEITSVDTIKESEDGEAGVQEASSTSDTPVSAAPELQPENTDVAEDTDLPSSATERRFEITSVDTIKESEGGEAGVQEASSTPDTPVSAAPELQPENTDVAEDTDLPPSATERRFEITSVDTIKESEDGEAGVQEASSTYDTPVSAETGKKKKPWWRRCLLSRRKKQKSESPAETDGAERSPPPETAETDSSVISDFLPAEAPKSRQSTPTGHGGSLQAESDTAGLWEDIYGCLFTSARTETLSREELVCLGLPNLAQTCYMNSTLQGLLTLTRFVQEVHNQQEVLSSGPESRLMRGFVEVGVCRFSSDKAEKKSVLAAFKKTVAEFNSEFEDNSQKDAHEFLSCVLDQLRSLSVHMGIRYTCPVDAHIAFQMSSTRTCKGCGLQSTRQEDYMNLSLDLVPGGSVSQCLQEYLKESQLEYRCECGAEDSSQQWSFWTLPNVLILQLKRFRFTRSFSLEKVDSPVLLSRELAVNPGSGVAEQTTTRYSLVSIVSHLGSTAHSGHYICDGAHRDQEPGDVTDRWLTYNDEDVSETTGASVCHQRRRTAYLLLYEKQQ